MKNRFETSSSAPRTPSEAFSEQSRQRYESREGNILDSFEAATVAKPFMDVAVRLHDAKNMSQRVFSGYEEGESVYDFNEQGSLGYLTSYAEKRAHEAANLGRKSGVTADEAAMLDVFVAEAEMSEASAKIDLMNVETEHIDEAWAVVKDRAREARTRKDHTAARELSKLADRIDLYGRRIAGEDLDADENHRLNPDANSAGFLLSRAIDGSIGDVDGAYLTKSAVARDAANMRENAAMYEVFAELAVGQTQSTLKELTQQISEQMAGIDLEELEEDSFIGAKRLLWAEQKKSRELGDVDGVESWAALERGINQYKKALEDGTGDELPDDTVVLQSRLDVMKFLAVQYPHKPSEKSSGHEGRQPEHEARREVGVIESVLAAARNNLTIHTDAPPDTEIRFGDEYRDRTGAGFSTFGSRPHLDHGAPFEIRQPEVVQFQRMIEEPVYENVEVRTSAFSRKTRTERILKGREKRELPKVRNEATGQDEPGVVFRYQFSSQLGDGYSRDLPTYHAMGGRGGNLLKIETTLPASIAASLEQLIRDDPKQLREIVHRLVITEGGVPEGVWDGTAPRAQARTSSETVHAMRPPYDSLPTDWKIALYGDESYIGSQYETIDVAG